MTHFAMDVIPGRKRERIDFNVFDPFVLNPPKRCTCTCEGCKDHRDPMTVADYIAGLPIVVDPAIPEGKIFIKARFE